MDALPTMAEAVVVGSNDNREDDDGSLTVVSGLAKEAALLFQSGKFTECVQVLHQLLQKKENDPKVLHNISLAENFQDGCSNPKKLIEELSNVKKRSEELARAATRCAEPNSDIGNKAVTGINESSGVPHQLSALHSSIVYTDEFDTSVTMYNIAVCWFHLHEYAKSFLLLEACFQNIEPIDEKTAKHICLLLLDVALLYQNAARSAEVISYVEKVFCSNSLFNQVEKGNSTEQPPSTIVGTITDAPNPESPAVGISADYSLSGTLSDEGLEDEALHLISSMEIGGPNLPRKLGTQSSSDVIRVQADELSIADMRIKLHLCKVRFLLLTGNLKAAKREVKMVMNTAHGKDCTMALYLKSQLEYARGNHQKAIKLLMASSNLTEMGISSIYYNNLGCIYYQLGKHHTSALFFAKALNSSSSVRKEKKPLNLSNISQDKSLLITYNCGVQYLRCGRPLQAARCFYKASLVFYNRPLLWLRIAECCLMALEKGLLKSNDAASDGCEVRVHVVGRGKWRQLVLEDGISRDGWDVKDLVIHAGKPSISVSLARQCLVNALYLLQSSESKYYRSILPHSSALEEIETREAATSKMTNYINGSMVEGKAPNGEVKEQRVGNSQNSVLLSSVSEYEDHCRKENLMVEQAVLADLAFVELELENPLKALIAARSLLKVRDCSRIYIFLGNVYAAEALCLLNRPNEAAEHLKNYISGDKGVNLPYGQEDSEIWRLEKTLNSEDLSPPEDSQQLVFLKPEEARGVLFSNLAVMSAMQGDFEQAQHYSLQALSAKPQQLETILTAVYVDLLCGRTQEALTNLKYCSCVRFVPGSLTVNGSS